MWLEICNRKSEFWCVSNDEIKYDDYSQQQFKYLKMAGKLRTIFWFDS